MSYSVNVVVTWRSPGGRLLGSALYDYDNPGDYQCQTPRCATLYAYRNTAAIYFDF